MKQPYISKENIRGYAIVVISLLVFYCIAAFCNFLQAVPGKSNTFLLCSFPVTQFTGRASFTELKYAVYNHDLYKIIIMPLSLVFVIAFTALFASLSLYCTNRWLSRALLLVIFLCALLQFTGVLSLSTLLSDCGTALAGFVAFVTNTRSVFVVLTVLLTLAGLLMSKYGKGAKSMQI